MINLAFSCVNAVHVLLPSKGARIEILRSNYIPLLPSWRVYEMKYLKLCTSCVLYMPNGTAVAYLIISTCNMLIKSSSSTIVLDIEAPAFNLICGREFWWTKGLGDLLGLRQWPRTEMTWMKAPVRTREGSYTYTMEVERANWSLWILELTGIKWVTKDGCSWCLGDPGGMMCAFQSLACTP